MPELELVKLDKSYGDVRALREMSLTVGSGEIFGFVGSNGAGKTTAMRIAVGVLAADAGEVRWAGLLNRPESPGGLVSYATSGIGVTG